MAPRGGRGARFTVVQGGGATTAPGVQHSSVLAVFASIPANDILGQLKCKIYRCRARGEQGAKLVGRGDEWRPGQPQSQRLCENNAF